MTFAPEFLNPNPQTDMCLPDKRKVKLYLIIAVWLLVIPGCAAQAVRIGVFNVDATPPIGSPVAYARARSITDSLSARGVVILSDEKPIVLCAVDWIGISNEGQDVWRRKLADAAHTTVERVSVHALHQHDGVVCDFRIERILSRYGMGGSHMDSLFLLEVIDNVAAGVSKAMRSAQEVTHVGFGQAQVDKVASNRRILGPDGKVAIVRWSSTKDPKAIAAPEGLIDPWLKNVSFWQNDKPLAVLTYYATHPQSYYGQGDVTCEFVGIARNAREKATGIPHIHFNGAGGNITAGKYNDGSPATRVLLTERMEEAMKKAWAQTSRSALTSKDLSWKYVNTHLPSTRNINAKDLKKTLEDTTSGTSDKYAAAEKLAWLEKNTVTNQVTISSLRLDRTWLLNLPGELFIEYQLAAQKLRPAPEQVCTAAYEEYGPGYIGTSAAYSQGGYETSGLASGVAPEVEEVLMRAIRAVLK
ncbi:hypothetical protein DYBT9275_02904 [Dyadobacter sp. CECT 9275]|uniref:Uncharacterized protein n=1 Tax=Dyadobacter helix TaxID=2822344 RepID=A0A916JDW8_9BACT|nr:hypothetical protein [Dyadobacter sp. CECT 9275]CAG5002490.1 hypothetical protein DYBT9275_02904 [Dyadobacter sp. CECT 9275]